MSGNKVKFQHFVPCVYLKQFSVDGARSHRRSKVWRLNSEETSLVTVEKQARKLYGYSEHDSEAAEKMFTEAENAYPAILNKVWERSEPSETEYFGLILMMFDLHLRSLWYENYTDQENAHAYNMRMSCFRNHLFLGKDLGRPSTDRELVDHLRANWRVRLLFIPDDLEFATSDYPSHWCSWEGAEDLHFVLTPVTPTVYAFAFDQRYTELTPNATLTHTDIRRLNELQVRNCGRNLFFRSKLSDNEAQVVQNSLRNRTKVFGSVSPNHCDMDMQIAQNDSFSFSGPRRARHQ